MDVIGSQSCSRPIGGISESGTAGWRSMLQGKPFPEFDLEIVALNNTDLLLMNLRHAITVIFPSQLALACRGVPPEAFDAYFVPRALSDAPNRLLPISRQLQNRQNMVKSHREAGIKSPGAQSHSIQVRQTKRGPTL